MHNEMMSAADMVVRLFENIDRAQLEKTNALFRAWKETVSKINGYGEKLVAHTKIIDVKNGTLLIETDHPGWTQILQMNENFVIRGLAMKVPQANITNLMIRLEGSDASFCSVSYEESLKQGQAKIEEQLAKNEAAIEEFHRKQNAETGSASSTTAKEEKQLPPELLEKFEILRKSAIDAQKK